jgi:hypothetical protein
MTGHHKARRRGGEDGQRRWKIVVCGRTRATRGEKKGLTCGAHMSVTGEREGGVAGRRKPKEKVHSCEGAMGHAGLLGQQGRQQPGKGSGPTRRPGPNGPE